MSRAKLLDLSQAGVDGDLAWADEQLSEALAELRAGRGEKAADWIAGAQIIVHRMAAKKHSRWWNRWVKSRASRTHLKFLIEKALS